MPRKLEFDRDRALTRATELFWKRGYVNTSVSELQKAMKLGEGSFYNTFKGKKALYLECLGHYAATFMARRGAALSSDKPAIDRLYDFFDVVISDFEASKAPGCLTSNSLSHEVLSERDIRNYLFSNLEAFLGGLENVIREAKKAGDVGASVNPSVAARVVFTYLHGLQRLSVYDFNKKQRRAETRCFLQAILS